METITHVKSEAGQLSIELNEFKHRFVLKIQNFKTGKFASIQRIHQLVKKHPPKLIIYDRGNFELIY